MSLPRWASDASRHLRPRCAAKAALPASKLSESIANVARDTGLGCHSVSPERGAIHDNAPFSTASADIDTQI
jgi:hypothetical protein